MKLIEKCLLYCDQPLLHDPKGTDRHQSDHFQQPIEEVTKINLLINQLLFFKIHNQKLTV
jgi:hypothetical protein